MYFPTVVNGIHEKFCKCQVIDYWNLVLLNLSEEETLASIWHQLLLSMLTSTCNDYFSPGLIPLLSSCIWYVLMYFFHFWSPVVQCLFISVNNAYVQKLKTLSCSCACIYLYLLIFSYFLLEILNLLPIVFPLFSKNKRDCFSS